MKLVKRLILFCAIISLLALTACSSQSSSSDKGSSGSDSGSGGGPVTLTYGIWDANQAPAMKKIAAAFTKTHPNIKVKVEVTPWDQYWTKLEAAATGGSLPDIFWMNGPNIQKYAKGGVLLPITDQIKADGVDMSKYPSALVDLYTVDGQNYAIPKDFDTIGLWYNKDLFDQAHVSYPTNNWTWDDLIKAAQKLTNKSKGVYGIAAQMTTQEGIYNTIAQAGGYIISKDGKKAGFDTPEDIKGIKFWTDLINVYHASPTEAQMTDTPPLTMFESGKVAMLYAGSWNAVAFNQNSNIKNKVDVVVMPKGEKRAVVIHGLGSVIAKNTQHPKEAWEFVKFLGSKQANEIQGNTGTVIPAYEGTQQLWVKSMPQYHLQNFLDEVAYSFPYPHTADTATWEKIETDALTKVWSGQSPLVPTLKSITKQIDQELAKNN